MRPEVNKSLGLVRFSQRLSVAAGRRRCRLMLAALVQIVEPFEPVGQPAAAGFQQTEAQLGKQIGDAAGDKRHQRDRQGQRHGDRLRAEEVIEQIRAHRRIHARDRVDANADVEFLDSLPKRVEIGMIEGARADGARHHDADGA